MKYIYQVIKAPITKRGLVRKLMLCYNLKGVTIGVEELPSKHLSAESYFREKLGHLYMKKVTVLPELCVTYKEYRSFVYFIKREK